MSDLVITKPDGMEDERWEATVKWLNGWLDGQSMFGSPWEWSICNHGRFTLDCEIHEEAE